MLMLFCIVEFLVASLACAVAQTAVQLIIFRAFQVRPSRHCVHLSR